MLQRFKKNENHGRELIFIKHNGSIDDFYRVKLLGLTYWFVYTSIQEIIFIQTCLEKSGTSKNTLQFAHLHPQSGIYFILIICEDYNFFIILNVEY